MLNNRSLNELEAFKYELDSYESSGSSRVKGSGSADPRFVSKPCYKPFDSDSDSRKFRWPASDGGAAQPSW